MGGKRAYSVKAPSEARTARFEVADVVRDGSRSFWRCKGHLRGQNFRRFSARIVRSIVIAREQGVDPRKGGIIVLDRLAGKSARLIGQGGGHNGRSAARHRIELDPGEGFDGQVAGFRQGVEHFPDPEAGDAQHRLDLRRAQRAEAGEEAIELRHARIRPLRTVAIGEVLARVASLHDQAVEVLQDIAQRLGLYDRGVRLSADRIGCISIILRNISILC